MRFKALLNKIAKAAYQPYPCTPGVDCKQENPQPSENENENPIQNLNVFNDLISNNISYPEDCPLCEKGCCTISYSVVKRVKLATLRAMHGNLPFINFTANALYDGDKTFKTAYVDLVYNRQNCISTTKSHCDLLKSFSRYKFGGNVQNRPCSELIRKVGVEDFASQPCGSVTIGANGEASATCHAKYIQYPDGDVMKISTQQGEAFDTPNSNQEWENQLKAMILSACRPITESQATDLNEAIEQENAYEAAVKITAFAAALAVGSGLGMLIKRSFGEAASTQGLSLIQRACAAAKNPVTYISGAGRGVILTAPMILEDADYWSFAFDANKSYYQIFRNSEDFKLVDSEFNLFDVQDDSGGACVISTIMGAHNAIMRSY
jgi:hypothetical protein